jgi:hypothetical protein
MIRINLHREAVYPGKGMPVWFQKLIDEAINAYAAEWQVQPRDVWLGLNNFDHLDDLAQLLQEFAGVRSAAVYKHQWLKSYGVMLDEADPVVVMYKLKYQDEGP